MITLLTTTIAGQVCRLASRPVDVDSASALLRFGGGLPPLDLEERIDILSDGQAPSLQTDIIVPLDLQALVSRGYRVRGSPVELAYLDDGDEWEKRRIALTGRVRDAEIGVGGHLRITADSDPGEDTASNPPAGCTIGPETWDVSGSLGWDESYQGKGYPWVFGHPGVFRMRSGATTAGATPAYVVRRGAVYDLLIGGWLPDRRMASWNVEVRNLTTSSFDTVPVDYYIRDDRGRLVPTVYLDAASDFATKGWSPGHVVSVAWTQAGGQVYRDTSLERAGDVLRAALSLSALPVDWRRTEPVCRSLDWLVGGYWDSATSPWDWVRSNLLSILPVAVSYGPRGLYLVRVRRPTTDLSTAHLVDGETCCVEAVAEELDDTADTVTLRYAVPLQGEPFRSLTMSADRPAGAGEGRSTVARQRRAIIPAGSWEATSSLVWSDATAGQVVGSQLSLRGPRRKITVSAPLALARRPGDVLTLTSSTWSLSRRPCLVVSVRREVARATMDVVLWR